MEHYKDEIGEWKIKVRDRKPKCLEQIKGEGRRESERTEVGEPSLCRWPNHHPNVLLIAAIHYRMRDCLVEGQVAHPSLSASGTSMTKP